MPKLLRIFAMVMLLLIGADTVQEDDECTLTGRKMMQETKKISTDLFSEANEKEKAEKKEEDEEAKETDVHDQEGEKEEENESEAEEEEAQETEDEDQVEKKSVFLIPRPNGNETALVLSEDLGTFPLMWRMTKMEGGGYWLHNRRYNLHAECKNLCYNEKSCEHGKWCAEFRWKAKKECYVNGQKVDESWVDGKWENKCINPSKYQDTEATKKKYGEC
eukprot:CAMPEP_0172706268 /NCGR_PEP_ID=MMETSP1074-20121228/45898_1 /TAXON_ID=2916 /ORGANISM="Ceratium fusus, Strain PA161109" /LENGTH=218 /DNA_ID=CAMNT_0013528817 /DNA_START=62 /DNA_END=718 /DNA_ORIENTATION=+